MKLKRIGLLLLVAVMMVCTFASCATTVKTKVKITFIDDAGNIIIDPFEAEIKGENPTVMDAVKAVKDAYATAEDYGQITLSEDEASVVGVDGLNEKLAGDADGNITYWMFLVNAKEPKGDANEVTVVEGDNIVFQFVKTAKEA